MPASSQPVPPKIRVRPSPGLFLAGIFGFAGIVAAGILFFFDPAKNNFYPVCQFHLLTGLYCPGCGATRASYQLLHGNFLTALHDNALYIVTLVLLALRGLWLLKQKIRRQPVGLVVSPNALWAFSVVTVVFVILRNIPAFSFLAPL
jgi:hypothetical protein